MTETERMARWLTEVAPPPMDGPDEIREAYVTRLNVRAERDLGAAMALNRALRADLERVTRQCRTARARLSEASEHAEAALQAVGCDLAIAQRGGIVAGQIAGVDRD